MFVTRVYYLALIAADRHLTHAALLNFCRGRNVPDADDADVAFSAPILKFFPCWADYQTPLVQDQLEGINIPRSHDAFGVGFPYNSIINI